MTAKRVYTDAEVDAIVATHTAIAAAHHAKYTDAEVDAIVATHTAIAGAHHTKTVSGDIDIHLGKDVEDAAIGNDKILVYKTATSKHVYEAPSGGGTVGHGFRAYRTTSLTVQPNTWTDAILNLEYFDADGEYNTADGKYTPQVAGYYSIHGNLTFSDINNGTKYIIALYKNAVISALDRGVSGGVVECGGCVSAVLYMNGSTDYVLLKARHANAAATTLLANEGYNTFSGWLLPAP